MSTAAAHTEHPPIYGELVDEFGDVPADVRATAERVVREAREAVAWAGRARTESGAAI
ncbi:hypothetical protein [Streptomyces gobiensis]|uniref:hypothetical protein n=1 Tax=Streptomyces gobiensis TaxID=2875706 RepID=UPI001E5BB4A3|nr:hypothetical protein [Streptomyces gobiensis]UGY93389.1 hypothetical protein test1122_17830 [Streptomyces gobiensis]